MSRIRNSGPCDQGTEVWRDREADHKQPEREVHIFWERDLKRQIYLQGYKLHIENWDWVRMYQRMEWVNSCIAGYSLKLPIYIVLLYVSWTLGYEETLRIFLNPCTVPKSDLGIPGNETARPCSLFLHSCTCGRFIYSQESAYLAAAK